MRSFVLILEVALSCREVGVELLLHDDELVADCSGCIGDRTDNRPACRETACLEPLDVTGSHPVSSSVGPSVTILWHLTQDLTHQLAHRRLMEGHIASYKNTSSNGRRHLLLSQLLVLIIQAPGFLDNCQAPALAVPVSSPPPSASPSVVSSCTLSCTLLCIPDPQPLWPCSFVSRSPQSPSVIRSRRSHKTRHCTALLSAYAYPAQREVCSQPCREWFLQECLQGSYDAPRILLT